MSTIFARYGIGFALVCLCGGIGQAAPPSDQSVNEMMNALQLETLLNQALKQMNASITKGMEQGLQQSLKRQDLTATQRAGVEDFRKKFAATMTEELSYTKVKEIYMQAYRETFTQEEVDGVIAFYKSPAGKAVAEKNPIAMEKANGLMKERISPLTLKLQSMQEEFVRELSKLK